jgi:hypothetical protein
MTDVPAKNPEQQRRAAVRTAWLLGAIALSVFAGFLWMATRPQ